MKNIQILDCTLRDGGYVNNNNFGEKNIKKLINYLHEAGIDIIECGYLKDNIEYNQDKTEFLSTKQATKFLLPENAYTLMLLGEKYKIENLPENKESKRSYTAFSGEDRRQFQVFKKRSSKSSIQSLNSLNF